MRITTLGLAAGVAFGALMSASAETLEAPSGQISVETLATLEHPWGMAFLPDGRLLVSEKPGSLRLYGDGALGDPIGGVPAVAYIGQGGLLGVAVDPAFSENGLIYMYYSEPADETGAETVDPWDPRLGTQSEVDNALKGGAVARGRLEGGDLKDVEVIWRQDPKQVGRGHFGGRLVFAPDGTLFIMSGDRQRFDPAQDMNGTLGKVIRINSDGSVPQDNPFVGRDDVKPEIYSLGHRNALGAAFDPATGTLWVNEMGPKDGDELNRIVAGQNYGWPTVSNGVNYDDSEIANHDTQPDFTAPVLTWTPVISPSGMAFYQGDLFAEWKGSALIGGLSSEALVRVTIDGESAREAERIAMNARIRDVIEAPDGAVLVLTDGSGGELRRLTPAGATQ